jgi:hypothetical protein
MKTTAKMPASLHKAVKLGMSTVLATGTFAIIGANPAQAFCSLAGQPANTVLPSCNVTTGDFVLSDFQYDGFVPVNSDNFDANLGGNNLQADLDFLPNKTTPVSGTFTYKITLLNGRTFAKGQANITGSNGTFSNSILSSGLSASTSGGPGSMVNFSTAGLTTQTFTHTFSASGAGVFVNSLGGFYETTGPLTAPGPLPLLGVGAAFGFSRKLRRRIQLSA